MRATASVSVVIPCFRCARTLVRAVASVAGQTVFPQELILVDDGSGDETRSLVIRLQSQYKPGWIRLVLLDTNSGAASARNAGWDIATQTYVAFLDADDAWHPKKIEIQYNYMQANPDVDLSGHEFRLLKTGVLPDWKIGQVVARHIRKWPMILRNQFVTPSAMVRTDTQLRFVEHQRYMEDHMLWMKIVCAGSPVVKLCIPLAAIYKNQFGETGLSSKIWLMEKNDLGNYQRLYLKDLINGIQFTLLLIYSSLKYIRRLIIYVTYLQWKK